LHFLLRLGKRALQVGLAFELLLQLFAKAVKVSATDLNSDLHGSPAYRAHLVSVMAARAVEAVYQWLLAT